MRQVYLDNSTTTRPSDRSISAMMPFLTDQWGTPSAPHSKGQELFPSLKESYHTLYKVLGAAEKDSIVFTSSGAEAINHAILSTYLTATLHTGKNHFLTTNIEEAPLLMSLRRLKDLGCVTTQIPVSPEGVLDVSRLGDVMTPRTVMLSLSWGNPLTGVLHPLEELASLCRERGVLLHLDVTHVLGKIYFEAKDLGADFISFNGDHLHAPKGTGALWVRSGVQVAPLIVGGMEQAGQRAGSYDVAGLAALAVAVKEAEEARDFVCMEVARLRDRLEMLILEKLPIAKVFFREQQRLPHCLTIGFPGVSNEALLYLLHRKGVCASMGGGSFQQIGLVLKACGIEDTLAHSAIHLALSRETTEDDIEYAAALIVECAKRLMRTSEYFQLPIGEGLWDSKP